MAEEKKGLGFEITRTENLVYSSFDPKTNKWSSVRARPCWDRCHWPSPMSAGLNYGLTVFEGMKAFRHKSGEIFIFRPYDHAERFARSLVGLKMPLFPQVKFVDAIRLVVKANAKFVPEYRQGSLYIRPIAWGDNRLGFAYNPNLTYTTAFWCSPVGNYYSEGLKSIAVYIMRELTRAMPGGLGYCKTAGNYVISRMAKVIAEKNNCNDALFLDGQRKKYIEELGAANVFMVRNEAIYTPPLKNTILPGITRKSIMILANLELNLNVYEKDITVKELMKADEVFATGTAAVVTPIGKVNDAKKEYIIGNGQVGPVTKKLYDLLTGIQYGDIKDKFGWLTAA